MVPLRGDEAKVNESGVNSSGGHSNSRLQGNGCRVVESEGHARNLDHVLIRLDAAPRSRKHDPLEGEAARGSRTRPESALNRPVRATDIRIRPRPTRFAECEELGDGGSGWSDTLTQRIRGEASDGNVAAISIRP